MRFETHELREREKKGRENIFTGRTGAQHWALILTHL